MFDPLTVILLAGLMSGVLAIVLFELRRTYLNTIHGLGTWTVGLLGVTLGAILVFGRTWLPEMLMVSLARIVLAGSLYLIYLGTQRFLGVTPNIKGWILVLFCVAVVQTVVTHVYPSYHARLVVATSLATCLFLSQTRLLWTHATPTFAPRLCIAVSVLMALVQIMRLVTSFTLPLGENIFEISPQNVIYLVSFSLGVLLYAVGMVLMASERLRTELEQLATRDSLTNALNRRQMNELFSAELERCHRHERSMGLLLMDLDHFKNINDTYGHQAGDEILVNLVSRVKKLLRLPDLLARFGGEEFALLLPETSLDEALAVAERIRAACADAGPQTSCTLSIGVTTNRKDIDTLDSMLARADAAMYRAKANGRNRVEAN
jgi:diguanylate cyclase (GGDEF)-like protein